MEGRRGFESVVLVLDARLSAGSLNDLGDVWLEELLAFFFSLDLSELLSSNLVLFASFCILIESLVEMRLVVRGEFAL